MQLQKIDAAFERHDPAVEQSLGRDDLPPEIVDDEDAAQRLDMQRRFVEFRLRVEAQIEHFQRELAARHDEGPPAGNPALVEIVAAQRTRPCRIGVRNLFVRALVEQLDDLAFDLDAIGDVDHVAEHIADLLGHRCLAVAGRTVEQDGAAGIDGGADLLHEIFRDDHLAEGGVDRGPIDALIGDG